MDWLTTLALITAVALTLFLVWALLVPEKLS